MFCTKTRSESVLWKATSLAPDVWIAAPSCPCCRADVAAAPHSCSATSGCPCSIADVPPSPDETSSKVNQAEYSSPGEHPAQDKDDRMKPDMDNASPAVAQQVWLPLLLQACMDAADDRPHPITVETALR